MRGSPHLPVELMLAGRRRPRSPTPGSTVADIDGIIPPPGFTSSEELAANLGIDDLRLRDDRAHGRRELRSPSLQHAALAVDERARDATCSSSSAGTATPRSGPVQGIPRPRRGLDTGAVGDVVLDFYLPYGARAAAQFYGWIATRHKQLYGTLDTDTGEVAVDVPRPRAAQRARR